MTHKNITDDLSDLIPQVWVVDDETFEWLKNLLDQPPKDIPGLRNLMSRPSTWANTETTAKDADDSSQ